MRRFTWTVLAAGVGATIALAGCSTTVTGSAAPQGAAAQAGASQQAGTVSTVTDLGAAVQHTASARNSVHVAMSMAIPEAGAITASGVLRYGSAGVAEQLSMTLPGAGAIEIVLLDGSIYEKLPSGVGSTLGTDKPWIKIDLTGPGSPLAGSLGSSATLSDQADPTQLLQQIAKAGTITRTTHETVNGTATTHYAITVDVAKLVATMSGNDQEKQALSELGVTSMPFDIWVDSNNLPVRIMSKTAYANPLTNESAAVTVTINYSGWGQPVTIQAPPADQVGTIGPH